MRRLILIPLSLLMLAILVIPSKVFFQEDYRTRIDSYFCVEFKGEDGWKNLGCKHNVITNVALDDIENYLASKYEYIALGNGSAPTASSTILDNEQTDCGLERKLGDYYDLGVGNWEINTTFTYTCDSSRTINTTATFNASSGGVMLAGGAIPEITFENGFQARIKHIFQVYEG